MLDIVHCLKHIWCTLRKTNLLPSSGGCHQIDFYFVIYARIYVYKEVLCWWKKSISRFWRIYTFPTTLNMKKRRLSVYLSVCTYVRTNGCAPPPPLAPERLEEFHTYSVCKSLSIRGRFPVNMNIPNPKTGRPWNGTKYKTTIFSITARTILIKFRQFMEFIF
jgi:hypothetical protein